MRRAPRNRSSPRRLAPKFLLPGSLGLFLAAAAVAAPKSRAPNEDAARQQLRNAERNQAESLAAQKEAAARAEAAAAKAKELAEQRVATAAGLQKAEDALDAAAERMAALAKRRKEAEARLQARAADMAPLLPLIERLSLFPTETLLAVPAPPDQVLQGVLVLRGISTELEREAAGLRAEQSEVTRLTKDMEAAMPALKAAQAEQAKQAALLDHQVTEAKATEQDAEDAAAAAERQAAAAAAKADNLRGVIADLERARKEAEARAAAEAARAARQKKEAEASAARRQQQALAQPAGPGLGSPHGQVMAPVAGHVVRAFGEPTEAGPANGVSYEAAPHARVVSPCKGKVVFAAPFRSYGQLLILDCGQGYHFVLAGLDRLDVEVGRPVQPGEPVGVMPGWDPRAAGPRPALYVELRHDGSPVNPAPWLKAKG